MQIEEKGLKETLAGMSVNKGTPLTLNFPSDKSKYLSTLSPRRKLKTELTGSLGGAMSKEFQRKQRESREKQSRNRGEKTREPNEEDNRANW